MLYEGAWRRVARQLDTDIKQVLQDPPPCPPSSTSSVELDLSLIRRDARRMMYRNYEASIIRWFGCRERGAHRFNASGYCMDCGAERRGQAVTMVRGAVVRREKST
jgi:hypothetical protein